VVSEATGIGYPPFAALWLAGLSGQEAEATRLIESTIAEGAARGQGHAVSFAQCVAAILYNSLGRYADALAAAQQASEDTPELYVSMWALPELIEAAVRSGNTQTASDALERLAETTRAGGTDFGLGIEARSRALLSDDEAADHLYREAIDRLSRTRLRTELARAHLLYGEWLRRQQRRRDARDQLASAYQIFDSIGAAAFAERARIELRAAGGHARPSTIQTPVAGVDVGLGAATGGGAGERAAEVPDLDAGQRCAGVRAGHGDHGVDRGGGEAGGERAVALVGYRLVGVHVEVLERGGGDHREGVEFGAEPAQRPDQLRAGGRVTEVGGFHQGEGPAAQPPGHLGEAAAAAGCGPAR